MRKFTTENLWIRVILFFIICLILIFSLQSFVVPLLESMFNSGTKFPDTLRVNITRAMNGVVGIGLVYVFLKFDRQKLHVVGFKWNKDFGSEWIVLGLLIAILALIPTVIIELLFEIIPWKEQPLVLLDIFSLLLTLLVAVLAIGLGEELLFRGYLQTILETKYSFMFSAIISAFLFGLLHFFLWWPTGSLENMYAILFSAFAIGFSLSFVFKITNYNLTLAVAIHGFWDFILFAFQAEFVYIDFPHVLIEIFASFIGAAVIFYCVYQYSERRLKQISETID